MDGAGQHNFAFNESVSFMVNCKTQEEIDAKIEEMKSFAQMYENPFIRYGMTLMEIFPLSLVIALISAGILRRKEVLPG